VPKVTQEHLDARRSQILDGARRAFAQHGYDGATVARLEEETGLSRGAIFHYFPDKQAIFVALAWEMNIRLGNVLVEHGIEDAIREVANESPEWLAVVIEAESKLRHDAEFVRRMDEKAAEPSRIKEWFEHEQAAGRLRSDIPAVELGRFASSVINGIALRVAAGDPFDVEAVVQLLRDALGAR
jgi:AcrR family transcriptional regulator